MRIAPVMLALLLALSPGAVAVQASAPTASASVESPPASAQPASAAAQSAPPASETAQSTASSAATGSSSPIAEQTGSDAVRPAGDGNTTNVMTLASDPARAAFESPSLALGSSVAMDRDGFRTQLTVASLDRQLDSADTVEEKKQILNRYRYRIENRVISLKAKEQQATQAFSNGTISAGEYARALGRVDAEAATIQKLVSGMRSRAKSVPRFGMETEANTLKGKLVTVEGPVRDRIAAMMRGEKSTTRVYVATAKSGIVLSTIVNGEYVREIVRTDNRNPAVSNELSKIAARERIIQQYPWAFNHSKFSGINAWFGSTNIYQMQFEHEQGELVVYFDGGTESVFKEVQRKQLTGQEPLPTGPAVSNTSENVTVTVNRTYAGGPLRVQLTNSTGAPLQGEVVVGDEFVGETDANGVLWTLAPAEQFRVSATHDFRTVNVTVRPVESS